MLHCRARRAIRDPVRTRAGLLSWIAAVLTVACGEPTTSPAGPELPVAPCTQPVTRCADRIEIVTGAFLPLFRTHDLEGGDSSVTWAVVVVHGSSRDADDYFANMVFAAGQAGQLARTVIVAPHFQTAADGPAPDEPYWTSSGWKKGHLSDASGLTARVSSYAALDRIVEALGARFPRVTNIVVTGHSAGGQVTHRYAAGSRFVLAPGSGAVRYVVANPSTYLYLGPERAEGPSFAVPDTAACPDYDQWHYGLQSLNTYMSTLTVAEIRDRLTTRDVRILVSDTDTLTASLDVSCGACMQGLNRYERGLTLVRYMDALFPGHGHELMVVPGVGHSNRSMYASEVGRLALFLP